MNKNVKIALEKLMKFQDIHQGEVDMSLILDAIYFLAKGDS